MGNYLLELLFFNAFLAIFIINLMTKLVGILNITPDSFSDGGKFNSLESAINQTRKLLEDGADMIDIGAESTRPGAIKIGDKEEWSRLEKILPEIILEVKKFNEENNKSVTTAIDSYHFETLKKSYEIGVDIINDVSGLIDEKIIDFVAKNNVTTVLMHSLSVPADPKIIINPHLNVNEEIFNWAKNKILELEKKGVKKSQLIFDPGIGFSKNADQSIKILKNIELYKDLGVPTYVGHSKKSLLDNLDIKGDRAEKTLEISKFLIEKHVDFIRVHDVLDHKILLK